MTDDTDLIERIRAAREHALAETERLMALIEALRTDQSREASERSGLTMRYAMQRHGHDAVAQALNVILGDAPLAHDRDRDVPSAG